IRTLRVSVFAYFLSLFYKDKNLTYICLYKTYFRFFCLQGGVTGGGGVGGSSPPAFENYAGTFFDFTVSDKIFLRFSRFPEKPPSAFSASRRPCLLVLLFA